MTATNNIETWITEKANEAAPYNYSVLRGTCWGDSKILGTFNTRKEAQAFINSL